MLHVAAGESAREAVAAAALEVDESRAHESAQLVGEREREGCDEEWECSSCGGSCCGGCCGGRGASESKLMGDARFASELLPSTAKRGVRAESQAGAAAASVNASPSATSRTGALDDAMTQRLSSRSKQLSKKAAAGTMSPSGRSLTVSTKPGGGGAAWDQNPIFVRRPRRESSDSRCFFIHTHSEMRER